MSIRGSRQRWNGTRRPATQFCARPAAGSRSFRTATSYGKVESGLRNGPFIAWGDAAAAKRLGY